MENENKYEKAYQESLKYYDKDGNMKLNMHSNNIEDKAKNLFKALDDFAKCGKYKDVEYKNYFTLANELSKDFQLDISVSLISKYYRGHSINPKNLK